MMPITFPATFFLGLTGIRLPHLGHPGFKVSERLKVMNERAAIERLVGSHVTSIGALEQNHLVNFAHAVVYAREKVAVDEQQPAESINRLIIDRIGEVQNWLMQLWFVKDNAVDPDIAWMAVDYDGQMAVNNNRWTTAFSRADGTAEPTEFSKDELARALAVALEPENSGAGKPVALGIPGASDPTITKLSHGSLRYQRFLYYVAGARSTKDVAIKIAHYCSGLEAIVSSSHAELTHQVSERVAVLIRERGEERLETFRRVKLAYGMRSKAVHGATFRDRDHEKLVEASVHIDQICREVALAFFGNADFRDALEGDDDAFNAFWARKLFLE